MRNFLGKIDRGIYQFETVFITVGLSVMALALLAQFVFGRAGISLPWAGKLAANLMVWVTCIGASAATREKQHIAIELVAARVKGKAGRILDTVVGIICISLCIGACVVGISFVQSSREIGRIIWELKIPVWVVYTALPTAFGLMAVRFALRLAVPGDEPAGESE